jgi:hypothetical protein
MKNAADETKEFGEPGEYVGQCRLLFNIIEQWDGKVWRRVPNVPDHRPHPMEPLNFGPY